MISTAKTIVVVTIIAADIDMKDNMDDDDDDDEIHKRFED